MVKVDKLNLIAPLGQSDIKGYHITTKKVIKLMDECGLDLRLQNLDNAIIEEFKHLQEKDNKDRTSLLREIPTVDPNADAYYSVTEFDQPTYGSISLIRKAKFVLTESNFCKKVFEKYTKAPVGIVNSPIGDEYVQNGPKYKFNPEIEKFGFKFLSVFEWVMRKNPFDLIKAFKEEFKPEEDVCLILRAWGIYENPRKWVSILSQGHNIFLMDQKVNDMSKLYRSIDCHVSSTVGEGFGLPFVESMACGTLNIIPNATACTDYATQHNSLLVKTKEMVVGANINHLAHLIKPWFKIQVPDLEELKAAMRIAFEQNCNHLKQNAIKVKEQYNEENTRKQIKEFFEL